MAIPQNELDKYVTYTYHFELHMARSWDELKDLSVSSSATTPFYSANTLMINTRMDAHQVIDDVQFECIGPGANFSDVPMGMTDIKMTVKEPGGFSFIEKLHNRMRQLDISEISFAVFGLKVIFVGRTTDIYAEPEVIHLPMIPMVMTWMSGQFLPEGGVYTIDFMSQYTLASPQTGKAGVNYGYTNKQLGFDAKTVQEALSELEKRLNENYEETYKLKVDNSGGSKKMKWKIEPLGDLTGDVEGIVRSSFAKDDKKHFSFNPSQSITSMIMEIIMSSPDLNKKIAKTSEAMGNPLHEGAFMPVITPRVYQKDGEVEVIFSIGVYKGGGEKMEFDYFFADAGKNVDVQNYNVVITAVTAFLSENSKASTDAHVNMSAQVVNDPPRLANSLHEDKTQPALPYKPAEKFPLGRLSGDEATNPVASLSSNRGNNDQIFTSAPDYKASYMGVAKYSSAIEPEQVLNIRGHLKLLRLCLAGPDKVDPSHFQSGGGIWVKVNIYMPDGFGNRKKFFYQDYYTVYRITNTFSGGVFSQQLHMMMIQKKGL